MKKQWIYTGLGFLLLVIVAIGYSNNKNKEITAEIENEISKAENSGATPDTLSEDKVDLKHKTIPESIRPQAIEALSYYPELKDVPITFKFKKDIKKSTMQAQPILSDLLKSKKKRGYVILISQNIQIEDDEFSILDVDDEVMIGWFGHELGHIMDYKDRSTMGMIFFGLKYLYSTPHIEEVERTADAFAIKHGMADYIIATKNFILDNSAISEKYKERIKRLYLSPEEIMQMVNEKEHEEIKEEVDKEMEEN